MQDAAKGIKITESREWSQLASMFHTARGNILRIRGYSDLALASFQKSYSFREKQENPDLFVFGLIDIGNIYYDQRNFPKAFEHYSPRSTLRLKRTMPLARQWYSIILAFYS